MNEQRDKAFVNRSIDAVLSSVQEDPWLAQRIMNQEKGETIVKKKMPVALTVLLVILLLSSAGFAVARHFGILDYLFWQADNTAYTEKIMTIDQRWEGEYFSAAIHEAVFDGMKLTFTMSIEPKEGADPVYVIPHIRASANGQPLKLWVMGGKGSFSDDGFWVPDIMPDFGYDYTGWAVDVALSDDRRMFEPSADEIEWSIDFDVLHTDWPIVFTEEDEPGIDEPEWTDVEYAVYEKQFETAYRSGKVLLNRSGMFSYFLYAMDENFDERLDAGEPWADACEQTLTKGVFSIVEKASFRFRTEGVQVKTNREPVAFDLPDGYEAMLIDLEVSVDQIGISLRITRKDGAPACYADRNWVFAVLASNARTWFTGSSCGQQEDGSLRYDAHVMVDGPTEKLILIPVQDEGVSIPNERGGVDTYPLYSALMEKLIPLTPEQEAMKVEIELESKIALEAE